MHILFIISSDDAETVCNAMRLANTGIKKGDDISVFMLGRGVVFEALGDETFPVGGEIDRFEQDVSDRLDGRSGRDHG